MTLFEKAVIFATHCHEGMLRKFDVKQYILHPLEVAVITGDLTKDDEVLAAAVLHDTVEDTPASLEKIREEFGERVAYLVRMESEDKRANLPPAETWQIRKEESLAEMASSEDIGVKIIWLADKLANMRAFYRQYLVEGSALWQKFNQKDEKMQEWYYRRIAELTSELKDTPAYKEYCELIEKIFKGEGTDE